MGQEQVRIFDTTLRDGEQSPGFSLRVSEKLLLARQLDALGVDIIEAGFPIASPADAEAVRKIAGDFGPKGVESPDDLADYCNRKLKRQFFNKNHMAHPLKYLARVGVVQVPNGVHGWRLSPRGADIYAQTKKIPLNK